MKFTNVLHAQRVGRDFVKHWLQQKKIKIIETGTAREILESKNIPVYNPDDILNPEPKPKLIKEVPNYIPQPVKLDQTHPNWHDRICYTYKDNDVLLEGLEQAKVITKSIQIADGLPQQLDIKNSKLDLKFPLSNLHKKAKECILNSCLFDAELVKLPRVRDPLRPAHIFPRDYGVSQARKMKLTTMRLLRLVETCSPTEIVSQRFATDNIKFLFPFEKAGDLFQIEIKGDTFLTSNKPLGPITKNNVTDTVELPNLFPLKETVTLNAENIYEVRDVYSLGKVITRHHPHTLFVFYRNDEVKNAFEEAVTDLQIYGRTLMKTFAAAASYARLTFGKNVGVLPKPVTLQCVHSDGQWFHFGVLQLNTLNMEAGGVKNVWYQTPKIPLYTNCLYKSGKPTLEGYNNDVLLNLLTFYNHVS